MSKMRFSKRDFHFLVFVFFMLETEKQKKKKNKMEKAIKPYKNSVFKVVIQKWEKWKKWIFAKIAWHYLCQEGRKRAFSCTLSVLAKTFFGPKQFKARKNYKNGGFNGNCPKAKMTPFSSKWCFWTWVKKWVLLTVFLKSCALLKTLFYSVFSKTQQLQ